MLIPGLPPAGSQNDAVKVSREVKPAAATEPVHEAGVQQVDRRRRDNGHWPERRRGRRRVHTRQEQPPQEREAELDLPRKGLLVDIEV